MAALLVGTYVAQCQTRQRRRRCRQSRGEFGRRGGMHGMTAGGRGRRDGGFSVGTGVLMCGPTGPSEMRIQETMPVRHRYLYVPLKTQLEWPRIVTDNWWRRERGETGATARGYRIGKEDTSGGELGPRRHRQRGHRTNGEGRRMKALAWSRKGKDDMSKLRPQNHVPQPRAEGRSPDHQRSGAGACAVGRQRWREASVRCMLFRPAGLSC